MGMNYQGLFRRGFVKEAKLKVENSWKCESAAKKERAGIHNFASDISKCGPHTSQCPYLARTHCMQIGGARGKV